MRKGQTAMEYLMTYGWAILIILIVGGLLVYYGVFSIRPGRSSQGFGDVSVISPWNLLASGELQLTIQNRVPSAINITNIYAGVATANVTCTVTPALGAGYTVATGANSPTFSSTNCLGGGSIGDPYLISVAIEYKSLATGIAVNSTGTLGGTRG